MKGEVHLAISQDFPIENKSTNANNANLVEVLAVWKMWSWIYVVRLLHKINAKFASRYIISPMQRPEGL
jgi:hypothetical protein